MLRRILATLLAPLLLLAATVAVPVAPAHADSDGPRLSVSARAVLSALECTGSLRRSRRAPVLFLHGTTSSSHHNWSWNWARALDDRRWAHCELDTPESGNGDIQVAAEWVTRAIRIMHRRADRRISLVGHSQGGMIGRWSLKWWPDTRRMVKDYVGLASSNHGTEAARPQCEGARSCTAAEWQQRTGSNFLGALNAGPETFRGISYTEIATRYDEVVVPHTSTFLAGPRRRVTNTTAQDACPTDTSEHFAMAVSIGAWLIALDALTHRGPARLARVDDAPCSELFMPGVDRATLATDAAAALAWSATSPTSSESLSAEPPLAPYARR